MYSLTGSQAFLQNGMSFLASQIQSEIWLSHPFDRRMYEPDFQRQTSLPTTAKRTATAQAFLTEIKSYRQTLLHTSAEETSRTGYASKRCGSATATVEDGRVRRQHRRRPETSAVGGEDSVYKSSSIGKMWENREDGPSWKSLDSQ